MDLSPLKVLIVDQSDKMATRLKAFLQKQGFQARACPGPRASALLQDNQVDVVMLDADLRGADPLELCYLARKGSNPARIVLMTSKHTDEGSIGLFGAEATLAKPFSGKELKTLLQKLRSGALAAPTPTRAPEPIRPVRQARPSPRQEQARSEPLSRPAMRPPPNSRPRVRGFSGKLSGKTAEPVRRTGAISVDAALEASRRAPPRRGGSAPRTIMHNAGKLESTPFPALLYKLFANQDTGVLTIYRDGSERVIFFEKGEPVYSSSNATNDSLGAVLVKFGYMELEGLNLALQERHDGEALGQLLVERGLISAEMLLEGLERQIYERILGCFSFNTGSYIFGSGQEHMLEQVRQFRQNPIQLIFDGVERFVGPNVLAEKLQGNLKQYIVRTEKFDDFLPHVPEDDGWRAQILGQIDGHTTLQALTAANGAQIMRLLRLVWSLRSADMIDFLDTPRASAERSADKARLPSRAPTLYNVDPDALKRVLQRARAEHSSDKNPVRGNAPIPARPTAPPLAVAQDPAQARKREALTKVVLDYTMRLGEQDHWQLLGVSQEASPSEVRQAFQKATAAIPAKDLDTLSPQVRKQAVEVLAALKRAFTTINDPSRRKRYTDSILKRKKPPIRPPRPKGSRGIRGRRQESAQAGGREASGKTGKNPVVRPEPDVKDAVEAISRTDMRKPPMRMFTPEEPLAAPDYDLEASHSEMLIKLRRVRRSVQRGRWKEAYQLARSLASVDNGQNHELNVLLAWIVFNLPHDDRLKQARVCRSRIEFELQLDNCMPDAYYYIGRIAERQGDVVDAVKHFRACVTLAPRHKGARECIDRLREHPALVAAAENDAEEGVLGRLKDLFKR